MTGSDPRAPSRSSPAVARVTVGLVLLVALLAAGTVPATDSAFSGPTANTGNSFSAAPSFSVGTFSDEVTADGPRAWWRYTETSGSFVVDSSGNGMHGALDGSPTVGVAAKIDTGVELNGSGQRMYVNDADPLDLGDTFTIEAWLRRTATAASATHTILAKGNDNFFLAFANDRLTLCKAGGGCVVSATVTTTDTAGFHQVAVTKSGSAVKLYIDGVDRTGTVTDQTMLNTTVGLTAGSNSASTEWAPMVLDELLLYPTALSAARVQVHSTAGGN
jgi:Concanavalin A-like lectin/glucanases superfamily